MDLRPLLGLLVLPLGIGCAGQLELGGGPEGDARLTADVYTWGCSNSENARLGRGLCLHCGPGVCARWRSRPQPARARRVLGRALDVSGRCRYCRSHHSRP